VSIEPTLALVESPAQLLNVIELGRSDPACAGVRIGVLAPAEGPTRMQLRAMSEVARGVGHRVTWYEPRLGGASVARTVGAVAAELAGVDHLVIGDPFSGVMQVIISLTRPSAVTVVDDGTATMEFARQWVTGEHLARWHQVATPSHRRHIAALAREQVADTVRRRMSAAAGCHLRVFSCLPLTLPKVEVLHNDFAWVRSTYAPPTVKPGADLIGTSLVESGVIVAPAYLDAVRQLVARYSIGRYFPHRKESAAKLGEIARLGVQVMDSVLPLEIAARQGPIARTVVSFPSTVVHTLPLVLSDTSVEVVVCEINDDWFTAGTSIRSDLFLEHVTSTAQHRHGLVAVAC
jgi:hypothetical protein